MAIDRDPPFEIEIVAPGQVPGALSADALRPTAETYRLRLPSLRFCIMLSFEVLAGSSASRT